MKQKKKKIVPWVIAGIGIALLIIIFAALVLFRNELRSLMSLKKVDDYGMYQIDLLWRLWNLMTFLKLVLKMMRTLKHFVTKRL